MINIAKRKLYLRFLGQDHRAPGWGFSLQVEVLLGELAVCDDDDFYDFHHDYDLNYDLYGS